MYEDVRVTVFVTTPIAAKDSFDRRKQKQQLAQQDYLDARGLRPEQVNFLDTSCLIVDDQAMLEAGITNPRLKNVSLAVDMLSLCDEAVFGVGWQKSRFCRVLENICVQYGIPTLWVYKNNIKTNKTEEWREEHNVTVYLKQEEAQEEEEAPQ